MAVFTAEQRNHGERLDVFLSKQLNLPRATIQLLIKGGSVFINAKKILKSSQRVRENDRVAFAERKQTKQALVAPNASVPLTLVFENQNVVVIEKPAGILSHPTKFNRDYTVVNWLLAHFPEMKLVGDHEERPGLVHRLDKDTSGLMVAARTEEAFYNLKAQFAQHTISKQYLALVLGIPKERSGTITFPINVSLKRTVKRKVDRSHKTGTPATTHWKIRKTFADTFALLDVKIETGRTHQIRVHLAAIHHAVVGDRLYGGRPAMELGLKRQFLHAYSLSFKDVDGNILAFEIDLPKDLQDVLSRIGD
ncbi:MAG: RluA family pseudouridine synthase [Candidatus Harrisonbacteria bacterium CG10_big_fil_rev_8_21_14_0_10_42_17]|uniref:Pseudouridine synthase n=1 Tax=Candidatus Harrisonbacteria bacterium CG10_big_fil_rev_8_21_14_0_10_42_17 TaxID=1974584 RepID=A0A2M6WJ50_9BACT|nr:MAG: RluA family pseudouridine synthase [Candidatus Harrisonbacteria bacterium CG10_big_fil_rev_8_21_14_0_10_42_17]